MYGLKCFSSWLEGATTWIRTMFAAKNDESWKETCHRVNMDAPEATASGCSTCASIPEVSTRISPHLRLDSLTCHHRAFISYWRLIFYSCVCFGNILSSSLLNIMTHSSMKAIYVRFRLIEMLTNCCDVSIQPA